MDTDPGRSLIAVCTHGERNVLHAAAAAGYLTLETQAPMLLPHSRPYHLRAHAAVRGRVLALRTLGFPVLCFERGRLVRYWLRRLSVKENVRSIPGSWRRVLRRCLYRPRALVLLSFSQNECIAQNEAAGAHHHPRAPGFDPALAERQLHSQLAEEVPVRG